MFRNLAITAVAAGGILMSGASGAQAATACGSATTDDFSGTDAQKDANRIAWKAGTDGLGTDDFVTASNGSLMCEFSDLGRTTQSNETEQEVNDYFFTSATSGWSEILDGSGESVENSGYTDTGVLQTSGDNGDGFAYSGNWTIKSDLFDNPLYNNTALLVFKDGSADPSTFVAYKVTRTGSGDVTGTYSSMFFGNNGLKGGAVSNISLYGGFDDDFQGGFIPLPAGLPLLLSALGLGSLLRLRQRKAA